MSTLKASNKNSNKIFSRKYLIICDKKIFKNIGHTILRVSCTLVHFFQVKFDPENATYKALHLWHTLRKKCPYSVLFWSIFSDWIQRDPEYSVRSRENADQTV